MLRNLSAEIRECYKHAENWVHKAAAQCDPKLKANFLNLELRRLLLARSDEFTKRLADFSSEAAHRGTACEELMAPTPTMPDGGLPSW